VTLCGCGIDYLTLPLDHECDAPTRARTATTPRPGSLLDRLVEAAADAWSVDPSDVVGRDQRRFANTARLAVVYLARRLDPDLTFRQIAAQLSDRTHGAAMNSHRTALVMLESDPGFAETVDEIELAVAGAGRLVA
jgi:chromosomal replication initiation ATPase DnaA